MRRQTNTINFSASCRWRRESSSARAKEAGRRKLPIQKRREDASHSKLRESSASHQEFRTEVPWSAVSPRTAFVEDCSTLAPDREF